MMYQREPWPDFIKEAQPLLPLHWEELALNKDKVPLDPDYAVYDAADSKGNVLVVTARDESKLIGYFIGFLSPGLHYKTCRTLQGDIFYIHPDYRGAGCGIHLFNQVRIDAMKEQVQRIFIGSKMHKDVSFLFERLGYIEVERYWSLWIGG